MYTDNKKYNRDGYRAMIMSRNTHYGHHRQLPPVDDRREIIIPPCAHCFYLQEEVERLKVKLQQTRPNSFGIPPSSPEVDPGQRRYPKNHKTSSSWQTQWANTPDIMTTRRPGDSPRLNPGKEMTNEVEGLTREINRLKKELLAREAEIRQYRDSNKSLVTTTKDPWARSNDRGGQSRGGQSKGNSIQGGQQSDNSIRPWKIAELYSSLYDTEWQTAFNSMKASEKQEEDTIHTLLNILTLSYEYCTIKSDEQLEDIINGSLFSNKKVNRPSTQTAKTGQQEQQKMLIIEDAKEYRKKIADTTLPYIQEAFIKEKILNNTKLNVKLSDQGIKEYIDKCVKVTWYMCLQNPKMILESTILQFGYFDKDLYRYYNTTGERYNFVVWPVLRAYTGGKVSVSGVAEAASERLLRNANIIRDSPTR